MPRAWVNRRTPTHGAKTPLIDHIDKDIYSGSTVHPQEFIIMRRPRLSIQLDTKTKKIYTDTAALMNIPACRLISDVLTESAPTFKAMQEPLKMALSGKKEALTGLKEIQLNLVEGIEK